MGRARLMLSFIASWIIVWLVQGHAQSQGLSSAEIYAATADSVLLLEVRGADNKVVGQATAFVVAPGQLLTNAHAVEGGPVWIRMGPVALPATVARTDSLNDLALVQIGAELNLPALQFAEGAPAPGSRVFAIGNPKGLERTISEGLVTSLRMIDNQSVLQVSAAISSGSSGGPVLNDRGEVIGVAVAALRDAQNLNFAVPAAVARAFIRGETALSATGGPELLEELIRQRDDADVAVGEDSPYQEIGRKLRDALAAVVPTINDERQLLNLFEKLRWMESDIERGVARRAVVVAPKSAAARYNLAWSLYMERSAKQGVERARLLSEAEKEAAQSVALSSQAERRERSLLLGQIQVEIETRQEVGLVTLAQVVGNEKDETARVAAMALYTANRDIKRFTVARKWFEFAEAAGETLTFSYPGFAQMLEEIGDRPAAAAAFMKAGAVRTQFKYLCDAARMFGASDQLDEGIAAARTCLEGAATAKDGDNIAEWAHRLLASMLLERGVSDQAINHARQAVAIAPSNAMAFSVLADALDRAERWSEAEAAARTAIRLSDGASADDHFRLGSVLFSQERWSEAKTAYEQAAKMNTTDAAATYNIALCLVNLGFRRDAVYWYEETLRRRPNHPRAADIRQRIQALRGN